MRPPEPGGRPAIIAGGPSAGFSVGHACESDDGSITGRADLGRGGISFSAERMLFRIVVLWPVSCADQGAAALLPDRLEPGHPQHLQRLHVFDIDKHLASLFSARHVSFGQRLHPGRRTLVHLIDAARYAGILSHDRAASEWPHPLPSRVHKNRAAHTPVFGFALICS